MNAQLLQRLTDASVEAIVTYQTMLYQLHHLHHAMELILAKIEMHPEWSDADDEFRLFVSKEDRPSLEEKPVVRLEFRTKPGELEWDCRRWEFEWLPDEDFGIVLTEEEVPAELRNRLQAVPDEPCLQVVFETGFCPTNYYDPRVKSRLDRGNEIVSETLGALRDLLSVATNIDQLGWNALCLAHQAESPAIIEWHTDEGMLCKFAGESMHAFVRNIAERTLGTLEYWPDWQHAQLLLETATQTDIRQHLQDACCEERLRKESAVVAPQFDLSKTHKRLRTSEAISGSALSKTTLHKLAHKLDDDRAEDAGPGFYWVRRDQLKV